MNTNQIMKAKASYVYWIEDTVGKYVNKTLKEVRKPLVKELQGDYRDFVEVVFYDKNGNSTFNESYLAAHWDSKKIVKCHIQNSGHLTYSSGFYKTYIDVFVE